MDMSMNSYLLLIGFATILDLKFVKADFLEEVCMQSMDEGQLCEVASPHIQYFFSTALERCVPFEYKGCGGNNNRFQLQDDCTDSCQIDWYKEKNKQHGSSQHEIGRKSLDCHKPAQVGPCKALILQWHFDPKTGKCETFSYGGCLGNKNRFDTEAECKSVCMRTSK